MARKADSLYIPDERIAYWHEQFPGTFETEGTRALFALRAIAKRLDAAASAWLAKFDLTSAKYNYLVVLYAAMPAGLQLTELSHKIHTSNASVTVMVDSLEAAGLVRRAEKPEDRRHSFVTLTKAGQRIIKRAFPAHHRCLEETLRDVPVAERRALVETLLKLGAGLDRVTGVLSVDDTRKLS